MLRNVEAERVRHGLSKDDLATMLGVSARTYYNWISEETDMPSSALVRIGKMFNVDIGYLMDGCKGASLSKGV